MRKITLYHVFILFLICAGPNLGLADARIAVLTSFENAATKEMVQAFQEQLKSQGTEADFTFYNLDKSAKKATEATRQIKEKGADLVFTMGSLATDIAGTSIHDLPVVACMVSQTETLKQYPNMTGVALEFPIDIQFEWIRRFFPEARNVGVLYNPEENQKVIVQARESAKKAGLNLVAREILNPTDIPKSLEHLSNNVDVLWGVTDQTVLNKTTAKNILLFSFRNRIPFIGLSAPWVKAGAFYALDRDYTDLGRQCGDLAFKVLQGAEIKSIKPETPRQIAYSLNLKTAQQMKIELSDSITKNAQKVY